MIIKHLLQNGLIIFTSFMLLTLSASASTCVTLTKNLSRTSTDAEVLTLQQFLFDAGYLKIKPSGLFSSITASAVKSFQLANGISPVGSVGPMTRAKVREVSCKGAVAGVVPSQKNIQVSSTSVITWDFNSDKAFILKFEDFKFKENPNAVFRMLLPESPSKKIKKVELITTSDCVEKGKSRMPLFGPSLKENYATYTPGVGLDIPVNSIQYWGHGGFFFTSITYYDETILISKKSIYPQLHKWYDSNDLSFDDVVKIYGECRLNDDRSSYNIQQLKNVIKYNNRLVATKEEYQKSQSCIDFYNENKEAFKECIVSDDGCMKQYNLLGAAEEKVEITSSQCVLKSVKLAASPDARNAKRLEDVGRILRAVSNFPLDSKMALWQSLSTTPTEVCSSTGSVCLGMIDLGELLTADEKYLDKVPVDPQSTTKNGSGYLISRVHNGEWVKVEAPLTEGKDVIRRQTAIQK